MILDGCDGLLGVPVRDRRRQGVVFTNHEAVGGNRAQHELQHGLQSFQREGQGTRQRGAVRGLGHRHVEAVGVAEESSDRLGIGAVVGGSRPRLVRDELVNVGVPVQDAADRRCLQDGPEREDVPGLADRDRRHPVGPPELVDEPFLD